MNKAYGRLLLSSILLLVVMTLNSLFNFFNSYTIILFLLVFLALIYNFIGHEKNNKMYQKDIIIKVLIWGISYYLITYILGIFVGFNKTGYSLKLLSIIKNILPLLLTIPIAEFIRYIFITKGYVFKSILILTTISFIMIDITLLVHSYSHGLVYFVVLVLMPCIAKNIFLIYITYKSGYKPAIIYRLLFELPIYILPFFPTFGIYIDSLLQFLFPLILIYIIRSGYSDTKAEVIVSRGKTNIEEKIFVFFISLIMIGVIALTSGFFKYFIITIGSNSMVPAINKGDILIVKKLNAEEKNKLKEKDILVFKHDSIVIVHRIKKIKEINRIKYYYTKGDNNNSEDGYPILESDVIGTTKLKIPYIGYFTVELNEIIREMSN